MLKKFFRFTVSVCNVARKLNLASMKCQNKQIQNIHKAHLFFKFCSDFVQKLTDFLKGVCQLELIFARISPLHAMENVFVSLSKKTQIDVVYSQ